MAWLTYFILNRIIPRWNYSIQNKIGDLQNYSTYSDLFKTLLAIDPDGATGEHFHSLVDNVKEPRIFVINDNTRAYPGYLITYKLQGRLEIGEGASVLARPNKYFKLQHGGLSQAHSTALPLHRSLLHLGLHREAAGLVREKACPTYHNATDNQGVMAKVRLCARVACCRCTEGRSLQT